VKTRVSKWYLDCIDEKGNLLIGYTASISLGFIPLHLVSQLTLINGEIDQRIANTWLRHTEPVETNTTLTWTCPKLRLKGLWKPLLTPASRRLFENERGSVLWYCAQPLSEVNVAWNGKEAIRGLGYAEKLDLTLAPGDIGLTQLHWGRFTAPKISIIWIQWGEQEYRSIVLLNGKDIDNSVLSDNRLIMSDNVCLEWTDSVCLRSGAVKTSVLESLPLLKKMLPAWMSDIHESKWRSRGRLFDGAHLKAEGWVIHETVIFGSQTHTKKGYGEGL
jgi:hypothetical protein